MLIKPDFGSSQKTPLGVLKVPMKPWNWSMLMLRNTAVSLNNEPVVCRSEETVNGDPVLQRVNPCRFQPPIRPFSNPPTLRPIDPPFPKGSGYRVVSESL